MMRLIAIACLCLTICGALQAQSVAGRWCAESNRSDCLVLTATSSQDLFNGIFYDGSNRYALATGYFRDGKMALAFARVNSREIGYATFHFQGADRADARTFNADGTQRWRGVYVRHR